MDKTLVPPNTLMGLSDELLEIIIGYAVTSDEAVNLYPETYDQDLSALKKRLFAPFLKTPRLLAIAQDQYHEGNFIFRTNLGRLSVVEGEAAAVFGRDAITDIANQDSNPVCSGAGSHADSLTPWFGDCSIAPAVVHLASLIHHVEVLIPMEPSWMPSKTEVQQRAELNKAIYLFARLERAFPSLQSLLVRITIYSIGSGLSPKSPRSSNGTSLERRDSLTEGEKDLVAMDFRRKIANTLRAIDSMRLPPKEKSIVLFQRAERKAQQYRDGPLEYPARHVGRTGAGRSAPEGFAERLMAHSSYWVDL